jgi:ribosome-associated protein
LEISEIAVLAAKAADNKKAENTIVLDIRGLSVFADYFVITSGRSKTQVQSIADEIKEKLQEAGIEIKGTEGYADADWVLIDVGDVVIHVFHTEEREFYKLERLWKDAEMLEWTVQG